MSLFSIVGSCKDGNAINNVSKDMLLEINSYGLLNDYNDIATLDRYKNATPSNSSLIQFVCNWPFTCLSGYNYNGKFCIDKISGTIPVDYNKEKTLKFINDLIINFGHLEYKNVSPFGEFVFRSYYE